MAAPDEHDEAIETAPPKKSKAKLFIMLGVLVLVLGGGGAAAWFFMQGDDDPDKPKAVKAVPPQFLDLETFTVNLQGGEQFLQVDITLQLPDVADVDAVKQHMPRVRSRLLALLASKQSDELYSPEGKAQLAGEIKAEIMKPLHPSIQPPKVDDVLFTSFVIQ